MEIGADVRWAAGGVGLDLAANGGLGLSGGKLGVNTDGVSTEIAANVLSVKDGGITTVKMGDGQVTNAKIAGRAVDGGKLAVGAVLTENLGDGQVTLLKCAFALPVVPTFVDGEVPSGVIDGANQSFTLAHAPAGGSLHLYQNGLRQTPTTHYTLAGDTVSFVTAPPLGATLLADYRY